MKKFIIALVAMFTMTFTTASAMSYEQARQQALFLTDKMAYELNLTDDQYEAAYEVNLDYLMGINTYDDLYGVYWRQRNLDLSYILLDWQYRAFCDATYFYRPLYWDGGYWHFGIYARYPRRDYFFFGRPHFYVSYRGDHCWRVNGGRSWYHGRAYGRPFAGGQPRMGMRDGFNRGDYGRGQSFGNMQRQSSTRTTVTRDRNFGNGSFHNSRVESNRNYNGGGTFGGGTFGGGTFGSRSNNSRSNMSRDFTPRSTTPNSSSFGGNRSFGGSNRSFNSGSNSRSNSRSFNSGSSNRSFGGGGTSRSFGGGGSHSNGGSKSGGGSFGGRR
ncbi:hypothetical protein F7D73_00410 [Prevotella copri]|uniref:DUF3300 domain-containing protein n=1 Tax=Segatella copri TaxID=165179 RepID=A0A6G1TY40_9BACT|nr:hypothetical protein [Segatella copri]MBV3403072.1 hypothetical protein [Segatella copri]MQN79451.1 hypothetical protein [Segatella copri]